MKFSNTNTTPVCLILLIYLILCPQYSFGLTDKIEKDNETINKLFIDAENGDKEAQLLFGLVLEDNKLYDKARMYYKKSLEQGHTVAALYLGRLYYSGLGGRLDYQKAKKLFELTEDLGGNIYLGHIYKYGHGVDKDYNKARYYYEQAADKGEAVAFRELGEMYINGQGVRQDYHKAFKYLYDAYNKGDYFSAIGLGYLYSNGLGTRQDPRKAFMCAKNALDNGSKLSSWYRASLKHILGTYYEMGDIVKQDLKLAKELYGESCDGGYQKGCDSYKNLNERGY